MKIILLIIIGIHTIISSKARLIIRNSKLTTETNIKATLPLRLTRDVSENDSLMSFSKEDPEPTDEFMQSYNKRKYVFRLKSKYQIPNITRVPRKSSENTTVAKNNTYSGNNGNNQKLVKKPTPRFIDIEYDDDFQNKVNKSPVRVPDSGELEDEDFNLGDYDFDVNHDEFVGRGKPLEPRNKIKETEDVSQPMPLSVTTHVKPDVKIQRKAESTAVEGTISNKKERSVAKENVSTDIAGKMKENDYEKINNIVQEAKVHNSDDELNEEESKEFERKNWPVRTARSPRIKNIYKSKEKTAANASKSLAILPMFPQIPYDRQSNPVLKDRVIS